MDSTSANLSVLGVPCPKCGAEVHERHQVFQCVKCDFSLWKTVCNRILGAREVEKLIREKQLGPLHDFRDKMGRPFAAIIKLTPEFKLEFDLRQEQQGGPQKSSHT
jgi:DNA topoisomerase-3